MRILNIHFKNINSLEGESRINFEQAPFVGAGVFAITGANGSGKSSILDAITLALYGETFRFHRPAEHVMTKQTTDSFATIEFALAQERYRSSWRVQRTGKEFQPVEMRLENLLTGEVLASEAQQVCGRIAEVTGMNFRNFTRSVLLAQGDFAAFLNALDNERLDILEKIINTDIYAEYREQVNQNAEKAQRQLARLERQLSNINLLSPAEREASELDLADFTAQYAEFNNTQQQLRQQQAAVKNLSGLQTQLAKQQKSLQLAENMLKVTQEKLNQLAGQQQALMFDDDFLAIEAKKQSLAEDKNALAALSNELKQLTGQLSEPAPADIASKSFSQQVQTVHDLKVQVSSLTAGLHAENMLWQSVDVQLIEKKSALQATEQWLSEHSGDALLLEHFPDFDKLQKLKIDLNALQKQQLTFSKRAKDSSNAFKHNSDTLTIHNKKLAELKKQLADEENQLDVLMRNTTLTEIDALKATQQERAKDFSTMVQLAEAHQRLTADLKSEGFSFFGLRRKNEPIDVNALNERLATLKLDLKREENIKRVLEESVFQQAQLRKMVNERQHLVDGKPCPLCGALQHPYTRQPPVLGNSQKALSDQTAKIKSIIVAIQQLTTQLEKAQQDIEKNAATQQKIAQISANWIMLCNRLNVATAELKIADIDAMQSLAEIQADELKEAAALASKCRSKTINIEKLKVNVSRYQQISDQLQVTDDKLNLTQQERLQEQQDHQHAIEKYQQDIQQLNAQLAQQLQSLGEIMPASGQEDMLLAKLNQQRSAYHGQLTRQKTLQDDIIALQHKQVLCKQDIARYSSELASYTAQLQGEENLGLHLAVIEKQQLIAAKEQVLLQHERDCVQLEKALQGKLSNSPYATIDEVRAALNLLHSEQELRQRYAEQQKDIETKTAEVAQLREQLNVQAAQAKVAISPEEAEQELRSLAGKIADSNAEIRRLEKRLVEQQHAEQQYQTLQVQLKQSQEAAKPYLDELQQIASEGNMAFRRRVQRHIIEQLLSHTNSLLEDLSGRYYLRHRASENGLALVIEDTYQAKNARRSLKTLSGGESFIVSLALALGLSKMASNGKSVDSLFLDEGFGNLDAENLYTVITTLENLHQQHGKTVGVISHVDAVQKRFKAQLQVVKKPNGRGVLRLV